jgi:hypothetical protein
MTRILKGLVVAGLSMTMALAAGGVAHAQSARQKDKNLMRNLGIALGAAAVHQAVTGKTPQALVLGAGAAYTGKKYEDARKAQRREEDRRWGRYDEDRWQREDNRWRRDDDRDNRYDRRRDDDNERERRIARGRFGRRGSEPVSYHRRGNGLKLGHYKNGKADRDCR